MKLYPNIRLNHHYQVFLVVLLFTFLGCITAQDAKASLVPSNILQRTFNVMALYPDGKDSIGTAFTIEADGRQYLISAKHIFSAEPVAPALKIFMNGTWVEYPYKRIEVQPASVDIAVLALEKQISPLHSITLRTTGMFLSEEVFFLGFPLGLQIDGLQLNNGYPLPLVKHGIISYFSPGAKGEPNLIDAMNVVGFSGGPVVQVKDQNNPTVYGVISGFRAFAREVLQNGKGCNALRQTGKQCDELVFTENTGLTVFYDINYALDAIKKNPIGFLITPDNKK